MSEPQNQAAKPAPAPSTPRQRSGPGFLARLFGALLMILLSVGLAIAAVVAAFLYFGFSVDMPRRLAESQVQLATAQAQSAVLQAQQVAVQTQVAEQDRRSGAARETLDDLQREVSALSGLRTQMETGIAQNATVVAEARASRESVAVFATAEAGRAELLSELARRSERIERFLQRLSDISSDAAADLQNGTPVATPSPAVAPTTTPTAVPSASATPTASLAATPTVAGSATPTPATNP